jgi:hypothetical protein
LKPQNICERVDQKIFEVETNSAIAKLSDSLVTSTAALSWMPAAGIVFQTMVLDFLSHTGCN